MELKISSRDIGPKISPDSLKREIMALAASYSIETLPNEAARISSYRNILTTGKTVNIAYLPGSDFGAVADVAVRLRREGLEPVPHLPARAFASTRELECALRRLRDEAGVTGALLIAGGLDRPRGPFPDTMSLLRTGLLAEYGIMRVGVGGHPEGSPDITEAALRDALAAKNDFAIGHPHYGMHLITQFCLDADPILSWETATRQSGITLPVHVGLPGATTLKSLLKYAKICGIGASRQVFVRNTRKLVRLSAVSYPDRLATAIARQRLADPACRIQQLHFFPFGGLARTADWLARIVDGEFVLNEELSGFRLLD